MSKTVHKESRWAEISRGQACGSQATTHSVGQAIGWKHFKSIELLVSIIRHVLKIIRDVRIHVIMLFFRLLFLLFNDVVINLNYFLLLWDRSLYLFFELGVSFFFICLLTNWNLIIILLWWDFTVEWVFLLNFFKRIIDQSFFKSFNDFLFLFDVRRCLFLLHN